MDGRSLNCFTDYVSKYFPNFSFIPLKPELRNNHFYFPTNAVNCTNT